MSRRAEVILWIFLLLLGVGLLGFDSYQHHGSGQNLDDPHASPAAMGRIQ
jgi:hypothetical protein